MTETNKLPETTIPEILSAGNFSEILCPGIKIRRLRTIADLAPVSLSLAIENYIEGFDNSPDILVVHYNDLGRALEIAKTTGIELRVISVPIIQTAAWCVCGEKGIVWSPGHDELAARFLGGESNEEIEKASKGKHERKASSTLAKRAIAG